MPCVYLSLLPNVHNPSFNTIDTLRTLESLFYSLTPTFLFIHKYFPLHLLLVSLTSLLLSVIRLKIKYPHLSLHRFPFHSIQVSNYPPQTTPGGDGFPLAGFVAINAGHSPCSALLPRDFQSIIHCVHTRLTDPCLWYPPLMPSKYLLNMTRMSRNTRKLT